MAVGIGPFVHLARRKVAVPLAAVLIALYAWLGWSSLSLLLRVRRHEPTVTTFANVMAETKDHDVYARVDDAVLDCRLDLHGGYGDAYAMIDESGHVAAMAALDHPCKSGFQTLEGIFRRDEKPGVYGFAALHFEVTPGRLVWVDLVTSPEDAYLVGVALFGIVVLVLTVLSVVIANRKSGDERIAWRLRTIALFVLAQMPWLAAFGRGWEVWHAISLPTLAVIGSVTTILIAAFPQRDYFKRVSRNWGITADDD
ncbi:MAG TPA: hypothetical protein VF407_18540 [Polyangiaceae bacterium]